MKRFKQFDIVTWDTKENFPMGEVIIGFYDSCLINVSVDVFGEDFHDIKIWVDKNKLVKLGSVNEVTKIRSASLGKFRRTSNTNRW